jgi:hypothetical protein
MKRAFAGLHEEFPDIHVEIEEMVAEGDAVAVRLTFVGTHAPSGERATWPEMVFARFSGGKAVESWEATDTGRSWDSPPGSSGLLLAYSPECVEGKFCILRLEGVLGSSPAPALRTAHRTARQTMFR